MITIKKFLQNAKELHDSLSNIGKYKLADKEYKKYINDHRDTRDADGNFRKFFLAEEMTDKEALKCLYAYLIPGFYITDPVSNDQANFFMVEEIMKRYKSKGW